MVPGQCSCNLRWGGSSVQEGRGASVSGEVHLLALLVQCFPEISSTRRLPESPVLSLYCFYARQIHSGLVGFLSDSAPVPSCYQHTTNVRATLSGVLMTVKEARHKTAIPGYGLRNPSADLSPSWEYMACQHQCGCSTLKGWAGDQYFFVYRASCVRQQEPATA